MALPQLASDWRRLTPPPKIGGGRRAACDCSAGSQVVLQRMQHGALAPPPRAWVGCAPVEASRINPLHRHVGPGHARSPQPVVHRFWGA